MNQIEEMKTSRPTKKTFVFLIGTMFLNVLGLTIVMPVLPYIVLKYTSNPDTLGAVVG